jgi:hypothetical protein
MGAGGQHEIGDRSFTVDADNNEFSVQAFGAHFLPRFHGAPDQISILNEER